MVHVTFMSLTMDPLIFPNALNSELYLDFSHQFFGTVIAEHPSKSRFISFN